MCYLANAIINMPLHKLIIGFIATECRSVIYTLRHRMQPPVVSLFLSEPDRTNARTYTRLRSRPSRQARAPGRRLVDCMRSKRPRETATRR
jgi:hypothetical protein